MAVKVRRLLSPRLLDILCEKPATLSVHAEIYKTENNFPTEVLPSTLRHSSSNTTGFSCWFVPCVMLEKDGENQLDQSREK
jgi:hypothetical protein